MFFAEVAPWFQSQCFARAATGEFASQSWSGPLSRLRIIAFTDSCLRSDKRAVTVSPAYAEAGAAGIALGGPRWDIERNHQECTAPFWDAGYVEAPAIMQRADLEASLAHIRAAEQSLRAALGEGENEENMELPHDLPAAYTKLLKDYRALCAQYENERKVWLEFKDWWRSRIRERRAKKQHEVEYKDKDVMSSPSSRRKPRSPHKKRASPEHGAPKESVTIPSPHRSRERILEHRSQVRALLQENPSLFKGIGRYAHSAPRINTNEGPSDSPKANRRTMHASDCACCRDVGVRSSRSIMLSLDAHPRSAQRRSVLRTRHENKFHHDIDTCSNNIPRRPTIGTLWH